MELTLTHRYTLRQYTQFNSEIDQFGVHTPFSPTPLPHSKLSHRAQLNESLLSSPGHDLTNITHNICGNSQHISSETAGQKMSSLAYATTFNWNFKFLGTIIILKPQQSHVFKTKILDFSAYQSQQT